MIEDAFHAKADEVNDSADHDELQQFAQMLDAAAEGRLQSQFRPLAQETVGDFWISTVDLGYQKILPGHPSFETMWFHEGTPVDGYRAKTAAEALVNHRLVVSQARAGILAKEPGADEPVLTQWVIYENPTDFPGMFVAREWQIISGEPEPRPSGVTPYVDPYLENVRRFIQTVAPGSVCLARSPEDDPVILETWL